VKDTDFSKIKIGTLLRRELKSGYDIVKISRWAYRLYSEDPLSLTPDEDVLLQTLFSMEDDPQFEYTESELHALADKLIAEEERVEFSEPDPNVTEQATHLEDKWLVCPLCTEAWDSESVYPMVRCPKCQEKLYNPLHTKKTKTNDTK